MSLIVLKYAIRPDPELPDAVQGWIRAENEQAALDALGESDHLHLWRRDALWPGAMGCDVARLS